MVATSSRDWAQADGDALIYGVLVGWGNAIGEVAARFGWGLETTAAVELRRAALTDLHARPAAGTGGAATLDATGTGETADGGDRVAQVHEASAPQQGSGTGGCEECRPVHPDPAVPVSDVPVPERSEGVALDPVAGETSPVTGEPPLILPRRGDHVAAWIKAARDDLANDGGDTRPPQWHALDELLDDYWLHADTGTPLHLHACTGPYCGCDIEFPSAVRPAVADNIEEP